MLQKILRMAFSFVLLLAGFSAGGSPPPVPSPFKFEGTYSVQVGYHLGTLTLVDAGSGEFVLGLSLPTNEDFTDYSFFYVGYNPTEGLFEAVHQQAETPGLLLSSSENFSMKFKLAKQKTQFLIEGIFTDRLGAHRIVGHQIVRYPDFIVPPETNTPATPVMNSHYRGSACGDSIEVAFSQSGSRLAAVLTFINLKRAISLPMGFFAQKEGRVLATSLELTQMEYQQWGPKRKIEERPNPELAVFNRRFVHLRGRITNGGLEFRGLYILSGIGTRCDLNLVKTR